MWDPFVIYTKTTMGLTNMLGPHVILYPTLLSPPPLSLSSPWPSARYGVGTVAATGGMAGTGEAGGSQSGGSGREGGGVGGGGNASVGSDKGDGCGGGDGRARALEQ